MYEPEFAALEDEAAPDTERMPSTPTLRCEPLLPPPWEMLAGDVNEGGA